MNIVLATDDNFVQHCAVTIVSVLKNNRNVHFYILTEGLKDENVKLLSDLAKNNGGHTHFRTVDSAIVSQFPMPKVAGSHISIATYYRLFIDILLPTDIDKVLYLDCDIVVTQDISQLNSLDLTGYALGCVYQAYNRGSRDNHERLGIPYEEGYFNAGVLMINLAYWRKHKVREKLLMFIKDNFTRIKQHDQDVLNAVLYKETLPISNTWNYLPIFYYKGMFTFPSKVAYTCHLKSPAIIHYVCTPKPWDYGCSHPFKKEYYKYLEYTPFKGFRPKFVYSKYKEGVLRPFLFKLIISLDVFNLRKLLSR